VGDATETAEPLVDSTEPAAAAGRRMSDPDGSARRPRVRGIVALMAAIRGRRTPVLIVIPLVLGILGALAVLLFGELGYRRLESATQRVATSLELQATINELQGLVVGAETGQRGFLLTGDEAYLKPYRDALPQLEKTYDRMRELVAAIGAPDLRQSAARLNNLVGKKISEIEATLALYERSGRDSAFELLNTGLGARTMDEIRAQVTLMSKQQRDVWTEGTARWSRDLELLRVGLQIMTAFTILLLLAVWMLFRREQRHRDAELARRAEEQTRLAGVVEERTAELSELSNYLQTVREDEKARIARDLHDEMGGILVSAKMDVASAAKRIGEANPEAGTRLARAMKSLDEGITIKRRIIEDLRPTLLDNLGLAAALDWLVKGVCERAGLQCTLNLDEGEAPLPPEVSIAIYRIVQEAMTNVVKYAKAKRVSVDLVRSAGGIALHFRDDGVGLPQSAPAARLSHGIAGIRQRVRALNGEFRIEGAPGAGTTIEVHLPVTEG
jgi:signal transduction histidine kinase